MIQEVEVQATMTLSFNASISTEALNFLVKETLLETFRKYGLLEEHLELSVREENAIYNDPTMMDVRDHYHKPRPIKRFNICSDIDAHGMLSVKIYPYMPDGKTLWDSPYTDLTVSRLGITEAEAEWDDSIPLKEYSILVPVEKTEEYRVKAKSPTHAKKLFDADEAEFIGSDDDTPDESKMQIIEEGEA